MAGIVLPSIRRDPPLAAWASAAPQLRAERVKELILLGTGTSSGIPNVCCLTAPKVTCSVCLHAALVPGSPNRRRNTSALFRIQRKGDSRESEPMNLLVDCGKTFYDTALEWFVKYRIRRIDALLLTHGHADAMFGLDDLRQWTLHGIVQSHIDIYLSEFTMNVISNAFPYLVDRTKATGGGDVPSLVYHIIDPNAPFLVEDVEVIPLPVEHGMAGKDPYWSLGFRIDSISYVSDASAIPESTKKLMESSQLIVMDALKEREPHSSHFCVEQAVDVIQSLQPVSGLLIGLCHTVEHTALNAKLASRFEEESKSEERTPIAVGYDGMLIPFQPVYA